MRKQGNKIPVQRHNSAEAKPTAVEVKEIGGKEFKNTDN